MTTENAETDGRRDAWAVSVEVDGRQKYLFETDKLQEMVGASAIMRGMADYACEIEGSVHLFQPASGEVRAWSTERNDLLHFAWQIREWLTDRGVEHTAVLLDCRADHFECNKAEQQAEEAASARHRSDADPESAEPQYPDLAWVHRSLTSLARKVKDAKPGSDARPACSLFEACRIHGFDYANEWSPGEEQEPRRALRGYRARAKADARQRDRTRRTVGDFVRDPAEWLDDEDATDQFVAFVCADGDGMGRLFTGLDWNLAGWGDSNGDAGSFGTLRPWERNRRFSQALDDAVREAFRAAVAEVTLPDADAPERRRDASRQNRFTIPVLPQLLGGDDLWTIARKDVASRLCRVFARGVPEQIKESDILRKGIQLSSEPASGEPVTLSVSQGIAFAKAGHPVHAMVEAAESLLNSAKALRKGHAWMRQAATEGCLDWHWIESSLSETVAEARARGTAYVAPDTRDVMLLTTRPWTLCEAEAFERAAERLRGVARRKREQLEDILRRGHVLSLAAWEAWWKRLRPPEQQAVKDASDTLPEAWRLPDPKHDAQRAGCEAARWGEHLALSPWIDVEAIAPQQQGGGEEPEPDAQTGRRPEQGHRYYVTPLLDLLALDHVITSGEGGQNRDDDSAPNDGGASQEPARERGAGEAHA